MKKNTLVTVYIPCRNYGRFLRKSIESVLNQLFQDWELIIIDEGSTDDTLLIAKEFSTLEPERIKFIKNNTPLGLQKLSNQVLNISNGKYMMRLDADDWLDESALLLMVSKLEKSPKAGLVFGNYYYTNEDGEIIGLENRLDLEKEDLSGELPPHGACTLFRTRALKTVGGYSEDVNAQDGWDLWFKLSKKIGAVSLNAPIFYYRQHGKSLSRDQERLLVARGKIFEEMAKKLEGSYKPKIVGVIPVKESYPNFEGVPYKKIKNKSLLEIAINNAIKSKKLDSIIVTSESQKVLDFSKQLESEGKVPIHFRLLRNKITDKKNIPIRNFMFLAGELFYKNNKYYPDIIVFLSMHAVNRRSEHIDKAINVIRINESDSVVSVQEEREPMFNHGINGLKLLNPGRFQDLSYDKEKLYRFNGVLIATWWEVLKSHSLFGENISYIEMTREDSIQIKSSFILDSLNK